MPTNVLLLRSPSEDGGPDKYEEAFRARGYRPVSVPVLETVHKNLDKLSDTVRMRGQLPRDSTGARYAGVIVTSGRACEAWQTVVRDLSQGSSSSGDTADGQTWSAIPFYAVGAATASALSSIGTEYPSSPYAPHDIRGGAESGTAEKLAHFIVADVARSPAQGSRTLLYLTGDKNRDTLPKILGEGGLELESLQVYATQGSTTFEADLQHKLNESAPDTAGPWWIVYFAPSAAKSVSPTIDKYFDSPRTSGSSSSAKRRARIAAIGPTTSTFLREELGMEVTVVAEKPTPEALSEGIADWERNHGLQL
ncbi:tetrapyrrole biosynthesis uroporphyrinogen III synthase [Trametes sanguinea]|nr:tetrapyrrole biosynthesis uroporphyrinogen III synthase [Trametes sanguinea]